MPTWKKVVISGSGVAQLSNDANYLAQSGTGAILSGSFSGSFTGDGSGLTGVVAAGTISSSAQIASDISGAFVAPSQSIASDISALQTFSSSLDNTFTSDAELNASSSALTSAYTSADTTLSSSLAADIATNKANIDALGDTYATDVELNASSSTLQSNIDTVASDLSTASGSLASRITSNDTDIAGLNTYTSSLKTAITVAGANVTIAGDLEVSGTTTTVDSTTVTFSDNIIALNGTGAANGGIEVNDANGPASGSLLWNGTTNQWIAGAKGSESKVLVASGDGILSGSAQIASDISGSFTSTSASLAADIATNKTNIDALGDTYATDAELNASSSVLQGNIDTVASDLSTASGSLASRITSNDTDISTLQSFSSSVDTALNFNGANVTVAGDLTVSGTTTTINSTAVEIADKNILLASGAADSSAANGAGITIDGANESLTWDHANSRFDFSDDLNVQGNITLSGTVDGIDLQANSSSLASRIATNASNLSNLTSGELNSGSFNVSLHSTSGSIAFTEGLEIGDVYDQGSGTTDIRVPNGASWLELNYADTDFIYLDGTNAGIQIDNGSGALEWTFYGGTGLLNTPGEVRIPASNVFSGSLQGTTVTAGTINGTINADNGVVSASAQTVAHLAGTSIVSSSAQSVANLLNQDVSLGTGDLTATDGTFSGNVVVEGNLTTTGTVTNINATDLNVEDKFVLLNSGSSTGNGGLIVQNSATVGQGTALFWDDTADRWGLDFSGADATADTAAADAYVAAVVTTDDANYQKNGNIRVDTVTGEAYIYVA